jgi:hypothetical protein
VISLQGKVKAYQMFFVFIVVSLIPLNREEDIFKVILTIFGTNKSKGEVVTIVTVNNGEASKVKFLDADAFLVSI